MVSFEEVLDRVREMTPEELASLEALIARRLHGANTNAVSSQQEKALSQESQIAQLRERVQKSGERVLGLHQVLHPGVARIWISDDFNDPIDLEDWRSPSDPLSS